MYGRELQTMAEIKEYISYPEDKGTINISEEVVAKIAASAALETEGVADMAMTIGKEIASLFSKKVPNKGVRLLKTEQGMEVEVFILVHSGYSLQEIGDNVQKNVSAAIEAGTGQMPDKVNVNICGITFDK